MTHVQRPARSRDHAHMRRALSLALRGWGRTAPNPMVGAVLVRDGAVVGEGYHARFGEAHAEVNAIAAAGEAARGATLYVTLEPCAHHGKTPPCVDAIIAAGVARVVAATADPSPAGGGAARLRAAGVDVVVGALEREARELNAPFFFAQTADRPWVTLKLAVSLDGAIADASGRSRWITGPEARGEVHRLRAGHDAIAVGIGTALADDPSLTVRDWSEGGEGPRIPPVRIVFDRQARLPVSHQLARTARDVPTLVVTADPIPSGADGLRALGVEVVAAPALPEALRVLRDRGIRALMVEGGARLAGTFLAASAADRLIMFQAPVLLGAGALPAFGEAPVGTVDAGRRLPVLDRRALGDDVMTVYSLSAS